MRGRGDENYVRIKIEMPLPPGWETMPLGRGCNLPWDQVDHLYSRQPHRLPAHHGQTPQQMEEQLKRYAEETGQPWPLPELKPEEG